MVIASVSFFVVEDFKQSFVFNINLNYIVVGFSSIIYIIFFNEQTLALITENYYK